MIYHLNTLNDHGHSVLLDERFNTTILHLTYHELNGHSKEQWLAEMDIIISFVKQHNIKLIIMDASGDPVDIDYNHRGYSSSYREQMHMLDKHCRTIIITDDWNYWYKPNDDIRYFSQGLWHQSQRNIHKYFDYKNTVYDTTIDKTKPLMCLNRNLEWHRIYLLYLLHDKAWFKDIDYSFMLELDDTLVPSDSNLDKPSFTIEEIKTLESIKLPINLKDETTNNVPVMYMEGSSSVDNPAYRDNAINLVTETSASEYPGIALTEKTAKPIMAYQIPVLVAPRGSEKYLEDNGIDMFSDYVPWKKWNNIKDDKDRVAYIAKWIDQIMQNPKEILAEHRKVHQRLQTNKRQFHSEEFGNSLIEQLY